MKMMTNIISVSNMASLSISNQFTDRHESDLTGCAT